MVFIFVWVSVTVSSKKFKTGDFVRKAGDEDESQGGSVTGLHHEHAIFSK